MLYERVSTNIETLLQTRIFERKKYFSFLGHNEVAEILISHGGDVNAVGEFGHTPLIVAAIKGIKRF